eukprot:jgi/Tetstr1/443212/TSEL_031252.t1
MPPDSLHLPGLFPIALNRVLEYLLGNPRLHPAADEYYHASCYGAFIADLAVKLRKLLAGACVSDGITPAFGNRIETVVHSMEAVDDGHRFNNACPARETAASRTTFAKDVAKDSGKSKAKTELPTAGKAE